MRKSTFSAVLSLFLLVPASITRAQNVSSQKGLLAVSFTQPAGKTIVYLPDDIRPGELVSGSIQYVPAGKNEKQIASNLKELRTQYFLVNGSKPGINNLSQHFQFMVMLAESRIELFSADGKNLQSTSFSPAAIKDAPTLGTCSIPTHALAGSPKTIQGPFDGNMDNTRCTLNGDPVQVLAESKRQCIISYPANATGSQQFRLEEVGKDFCSGMVEAVTLSASVGKQHLMKGESTHMEIMVRGLENLKDTSFLRINNLSALTVNLLPSNSFIIPLIPGELINGVFSRRFNVESIRTGDFSISVDLDLPEQEEHPPTQPQPPENPRPKDTTIQPRPDSMTVAQCAGCYCSCKATITLDAKKGDVSTYSVDVKGGCTGSFGYPPCEPCKTGYSYEWVVSSSADKPVALVGGGNGASVNISNPLNGSFTLNIKVNIICSAGGCECNASTRYLATNPVGEKCMGCMCECSADIITVKKTDEEIEYKADVKASCINKFGTPPCDDCSVAKTTYLWTLDGDEIGKISGSHTGKSVTVRKIKPGKFRIKLVVTITCKDGKECTCQDEEEGNFPEKPCVLLSKLMIEPFMTGEFDLKYLNKQTIRRDDFVILKAIGSDDDQLQLICEKQKDCIDRGSTLYKPLNSTVRFEWSITKGPGHFVDIGCLPNNRSALGEFVIFQPPYVLLPAEKTPPTVVTTIVDLIIKDDNPTQPLDPDIPRQLMITTSRSWDKPDVYDLVFEEINKPELKKAETGKSDVKECHPEDLAKNWSDGTAIATPVIILPATRDNNKLLKGEWIRLEAEKQTDKDQFKTTCITTNCVPLGSFADKFEDKLIYTWKIEKGTGTFAGGETTATGRFVVYQAPDVVPRKTAKENGKLIEKETDIEVVISVSVDDDKTKFDDTKKSSTISLRIYPAGVKLDYPPADWDPDPDVPATVTSRLVRFENNAWIDAFEHNSRIHFFELMDVSNEPGICLNAPARVNAKVCRDLKIKNEKEHEAFQDTSGRTECHNVGYFMQARTKKPELKYTIDVYAEDYGAFGFIRSFANYNKGGVENITGEKPSYVPVPVEKKDVEHPMSKDLNHKEDRTKKTVYKDNRVNIPKDIDENHIPDLGWPLKYSRITNEKGITRKTPTLTTNDFTKMIDTDSDGQPQGEAGSAGDGLSAYEEYRGFMVSKPGLEHRRMDPGKKDLFVNNNHNLPIDEFVRVSGIPVHEIREDQYSELDETYFNKKYKDKFKNQRFINFNFGIAHVIDQKGLYLINETIPDDGKLQILGITPSEKEQAGKVPLPTPPNWNVAVKVDRDKITRLYTDPANPGNVDRKLKQVVAHELSHACNVYHHGEDGQARGLRSGNPRCIMYYDKLAEVPGNILCEEVGGANVDKKRGKCKLQLRVTGKMVQNSHGYPFRF